MVAAKTGGIFDTLSCVKMFYNAHNMVWQLFGACGAAHPTLLTFEVAVPPDRRPM